MKQKLEESLSHLYNILNPKSDKGTDHDYINGYYNAEFSEKKYSSIRLMEVGVLNGESINLWDKYFEIAFIIIGVDITITDKAKKNVNVDGWTILEQADAYSNEYTSKIVNDYWDYIIDDGPHTLESQISFIELYYPKIKKRGKLIIEDIQSKENLEAIEKRLKELKYKYKVFDLTKNKGRYDDIIIEIKK